MLSGDETGSLLGEHVLSTVDSTTGVLVATTIVSSSMLQAIAASHGAEYAETLTGFKWLARAGTNLVFAYEEALGLCVDPDAVRDKDGISAAVLAADLAATRRAAGSSLSDALDELATRHGVHLTEQLSVRLTDRARIDALMSRLRADPPDSLAGVDVTVEDLLPRTDGVRLSGTGLRVVVRPSGTESKLKAYLQIVRQLAPDDTAGTLDATRTAAAETMAALRHDVQQLLND